MSERSSLCAGNRQRRNVRLHRVGPITVNISVPNTHELLWIGNTNGLLLSQQNVISVNEIEHKHHLDVMGDNSEIN